MVFRDRFEFKIIEFGDTDYGAMQTLRDEVLRKPLHLAFATDELESDKQFKQVVGYFKDELCATAMLVPINATKVQIRRVAVREDMQGKGVGTAMMLYCEKYARDNDFYEILVHARETAIQFYLNLGYTTEGVMFEEATIPHIKMRKRL